MDMPWICHGYTMDMPWIYHGYAMDIPWVCHGYTMDMPLVTACATNGLTLVVTLHMMIIVMVLHRYQIRINTSAIYNPRYLLN